MKKVLLNFVENNGHPTFQGIEAKIKTVANSHPGNKPRMLGSLFSDQNRRSRTAKDKAVIKRRTGKE